jgi:ankyrin repeat protein
MTDKHLINACAYEDFTGIKHLINNGTDIDYVLLHSAKNGYSRVVKWLIEEGADMSTNNNVVLKCYIKRADLEMIEWLIDRGANIYDNINYAMRISVLYGHSDMIKWLIKNTIVLEYYVKLDDLRMVKCLVEHGADGDYALYISAEYGRLNIVKNIVENMVTDKRAALHIANNRGHLNIVDYLNG